MTPNHGRIMAVFGGCHRSDGGLAVAITICTTWMWRWFKASEVSTHSSVGFVYEDGYREIFEAREGKSWQGPIPVSKVLAWEHRNKKRRFTMYTVPSCMISQEEAVKKYKFCMSKIGVWKYSVPQLPRMGIRKWLPFLPMKPTPNDVVCSEAASIVMAPQVDIPKLCGKRSDDRITPFDFEQAMRIITQEKRYDVTDVSDAYSG